MSSFACKRLTAFLPLAAVLYAACGDSTPPELSAPAKLIVVSGTSQSVTNGPATATDPLVVQVLDPKNRPVSGVAINWATTDAGASLSAVTNTTGADGRAQVTWTMGSVPGTQSVKATSSSIAGASAVFLGTNNVISISGAVSVSPNIPLAFAASPISASALTSFLPSSAERTYHPASIRSALARSPSSTRRLIVQFKGSAVGVSGHAAIRGRQLERSLSTMQTAMAPLIAARFLTRAEPSPAILATRVTVASHVAVSDAISALRSTAGVESVRLDEIVPLLEPFAATAAVGVRKGGALSDAPGASAIVGALPNEPGLWATMWHYNMLEAPRAWTTQTGSATVLVAVIDNGIRFDHPAMATCATYSSCSSGNLTTDGYNFVTAGARLDSAESVCQGGTTTLTEAGYGPNPSAPDDLEWTGSCWDRSTLGNHGLHVAGTIGARGNDGVGIAGINWTVKIRPIRVLDITGSGSYFDVAQGVLYAAGLPASDGVGGTVTAPSRAPIINMSLGGGGTSATLASAVTAATNAGSLIIAAAGNSESSGNFIPAAYPEVLAVSAVGPDFQLASYTNIGSNVSLSAPGGNFRSGGATSGVVSSTWNFVANTPNYAYYQGTSMASPHVAGVAALVLAANPGLINTQLRARLQNTATHVGSPGRDDRWGWGVVNAYNAVNNITAPVRNTYVHVISTITGDTVKRIAVGADGAFTASRLVAGSYWVVAGQDDGGDGKIGRPGRRFGWFGPPGGPTAITVSSLQSGTATILVGTPVESNANATGGAADRIVVDGWVLGQLNSSSPANFVVQIPRAATYTFSLDAVVGACGYGIELDGVLTLQALDATVLAQNDDVDLAGGNYCSKITRVMTPNTYFLRVTGSFGARGQFALHVREGT